MANNEIDLGSFNNKNDDDDNHYMLDSLHNEYTPINHQGPLFKFLLYATKVEIKANSLMKMIYQASLYEIGIWIAGFFIFVSNPSQMYYIWFLVLHLPRSSLGFMLLQSLPKTYEIIENVSKNPDFEEEKLVPMLKAQIRESFKVKWTENKLKFLLYFIATVVCATIDLVMLIVMIVIYGNDKFILLEICLLFVTIALLGNLFIHIT